MEDVDAVLRLEEQLTCCICVKIYEEPKLLQCSHVFCLACLQKLVSKSCRGLDNSKPFSFPCPACREETTIRKDVTELKPSFQTNQFLDVLKGLKADKAGGQSAGFSSQATKSSTGATCVAGLACEEPPAKCSIHSNRTCNLFCRTCNAFICGSCTVSEHHSHNYNDVVIEFEKTKVQLSSSLTQLDRMIKKLQDGVSDIVSQRNRITDQKSVIEAEIWSKMESLHQVLDNRLSELVGDLNLLTERKLSSLKAENDQVDSKLCPLIEFRENMMETINMSSQQRLLREKKILSKKLQQKLSLGQSIETVSIQTKADMKFSCSPFVSDTCRNYGNVYAPGLPHPSRCRAEGEGLAKAAVGIASVIDLIVLDYHSELCKEIVVESLECRLESLSGS